MSIPASAASSRPAAREYTVGWIAPILVERVAARVMLDDVYDAPDIGNNADSNCYIFGRIGSHKVVIASCSAGNYGIVSAATVATEMVSSFEALRFCLIVGIAGGIPINHDIRLGDVVVSQPAKMFGASGVVRHDSGKIGEDGKVMCTSSLNQPPEILLKVIVDMQTKHIVDGSQISRILEETSQKNPWMMTTGLNNSSFAHQGSENDQLFQADYEHIKGLNTCESCDSNRVKARSVRLSGEPEIHYGIIASGDQVVKHAHTRDRIGKEFDALCVEMESGGVMNKVPSLVIRGICDYADTHKNKRWQNYAALTAAAYAKEFLLIVRSGQMEGIPTALSVVKSS